MCTTARIEGRTTGRASFRAHVLSDEKFRFADSAQHCWLIATVIWPRSTLVVSYLIMTFEARIVLFTAPKFQRYHIQQGRIVRAPCLVIDRMAIHLGISHV
ncbi:hypothetical protein GCM10023190_24380 [Enteractinococcus fodinae]|uniref:Uncharacterized protein n=1 Tax=Enteractinococcus fodinae TaxID=684663 RepID=A0ABU2B2G6_9MICC|nr:hypothetical protein [Enteractinococcus fodinae]